MLGDFFGFSSGLLLNVMIDICMISGCVFGGSYVVSVLNFVC